MAKDVSGVKILNAALEERGGDLVLRGTLDFDSLRNLKADVYQREVLSQSGVGGKRPSRIKKGIEAGDRLPDIELGMRGQNFSSMGKSVILRDPVFIIDGLQRVSAMIDYLADHEDVPNGALPIGATVHFGTSVDWEKNRFAKLNQLRTPVSPSVLLRNSRDAHPSIATLYGLSNNDPDFPLYRKVCWKQRMAKSDLITATGLMKAAISLHRHVADKVSLVGSVPAKRSINPAGARGAVSGPGAADSSDRIAKEIGLQHFRENIKTMFDLIEEAWGIRSIAYGDAQGHLRGNFLLTLGNFIGQNPQLWSADRRLVKIDKKTRERFASFPVNDPEIRRLCSAGAGMILPQLYQYLLIHMNKRRPKNKFV